MGKLVNFKKRDVSLPPGCKDLIDALHPELKGGVAKVSGELREAIEPRRKGRGRMDDFDVWLARVYESKASTASLSVIAPDGFGLNLFWDRWSGRKMEGSFFVKVGTALEGKAREFFKAHHLKEPPEALPPLAPKPEVPMSLMCRLDPMPTDARSMAALAKNLFREVSGWDETAEFLFDSTAVIMPEMDYEGVPGLEEYGASLNARKNAERRSDSGRGGMADFEMWFERVYRSKAMEVSLAVAAHSDFHLNVHWMRWLKLEMEASVTVEAGTALEGKVRDFFATHGLEDVPDRKFPATFSPKLPMSLICNFKPMPADAKSMAALAKDFFREVLGLDEGTKFEFRFEGWTKSLQ